MLNLEFGILNAAPSNQEPEVSPGPEQRRDTDSDGGDEIGRCTPPHLPCAAL